MKKRVKFLKYIDSYRLVYRFEWDIIAVTTVSGFTFFVISTLLQVPLWASPFFAAFGGWKVLSMYKNLVKDAAPGYLYHFFYSIGIINPVVKKKENGVNTKVNPDNLPNGFETDFRD